MKKVGKTESTYFSNHTQYRQTLNHTNDVKWEDWSKKQYNKMQSTLFSHYCCNKNDP